MRLRVSVFVLISVFCCAASALAQELSGSVSDRTGGALPGATVKIISAGGGKERQASTDAGGKFGFHKLAPGTYRLSASAEGFSEASRTVVIDGRSPEITTDFVLDLGTLTSDVTVAAARGVRDTHVVPLRADSFGADRIRQLVPVSTGDILLSAPGVTAVGSGPFQVRPRLRGLDSTRVLVLVDGERLNNARTATDRAGVEVGLVDPTIVEGIEVLGGAGLGAVRHRRALGHDQHHHEPATLLDQAAVHDRVSTASTARTRTAVAAPSRSAGRIAASRCSLASGVDRFSTTTRPARTSLRARSRSSPTAGCSSSILPTQLRLQFPRISGSVQRTVHANVGTCREFRHAGILAQRRDVSAADAHAGPASPLSAPPRG